MEALFYAVAFVIGWFLNLVVLIGAMLFLRLVMHDLEFGSFGGMLWRGALLAAIVSGVQLIPCVGGWIALAVWVGGLVLLFELEFQNCLIAGVAVWVMSWIVWWAVRLFLASLK